MRVNFLTNIILQIITLYCVQMIIIIFTLNFLFRVMSMSIYRIVISSSMVAHFPYQYYVYSDWFWSLCTIITNCVTSASFTLSVSRSLSIQHPPIFAALSSHGRTVDHIVVMILCSIRKINIQLHVLVSRNQCNYGHLSFYFTVDVVEYIFNII